MSDEGDDVSDEIEVTVRLTPEDVRAIRLQASAAPVELRGWSKKLIAALPVPEPRTEYPLQRITESQFNGRISIHDFDAVLVAAHSVRVGDRVEWAPGDWREITKVKEHCLAITLWVDDEPFSFNRWDLVAVWR